MLFKKRKDDVRKCPNGHILDPEWDHCPYCAGQQSGVFLDESRAMPRPAGPDQAAPAPSWPPPPPLPPAAASPAAPARPGPLPTADPELTQISRPAGPGAPAPPASRPGPPPAPPPVDDGSGPPPLVEWSDAQGRPAPALRPGVVPPVPPPAPPPTPPPAPPPGVTRPHQAAPPHAPGSLDEPTRILSSAPAAGGLTIAWLVGTSGALRGQDFRIQPGGARIGRLASCGICLPQGHDFGVSKEHAEVRISAGICVLVDLGSANGTFVNGERITERALQDGDRVRFGLLEFVYKCLVL